MDDVGGQSEWNFTTFRNEDGDIVSNNTNDAGVARRVDGWWRTVGAATDQINSLLAQHNLKCTCVHTTFEPEECEGCLVCLFDTAMEPIRDVLGQRELLLRGKK